MNRIIIALVVSLASFLPSLARGSTGGVEGKWEGDIQLPGVKLGVTVDISREGVSGGGGYSGTISIPMQKAENLALDKFDVQGGEITFAIKGVPGDPTFKGTLAADDSTISGTMTQGGQKFPFTLKRAGAGLKAATDALGDYGDWLDKAREAWEVPGLAMTIVKGDDQVFAKGSGLRDVEANKPVTTKTLFAIGSSTKAFTTAVLGSLADEGKLEWDVPVRTYLPDFALFDKEIAQRITPLDLVTHRSGLPRHDLIWYNSPLSREEIYHRLPYLENNKDLRTTFQYNNLMFLTAGYMAGKICGNSWEDQVKARLFTPLGMTRSNFSVKDSQADSDFAQPYEDRDDKLRKMPFRDITVTGPAGSINSCVDDMARWVSFHLSGEHAGKHILSKGALDFLHTPAMSMGGLPDPTDDGTVGVGYAPGWFVEVYRGHTLIQHGGNIDGFSAMVAFMPQDKLGFVVLTNKNGTGLPMIAVKHAADRLLGLEKRDWSAEALAKVALSKKMVKEGKEKKSVYRVSGTHPSHPIPDYAGEYEHPGYGTVKVTLDEDALTLTINGIASPLEHWHYDVFNGGKNEADHTLEDSKALFSTNVNGDIAELRLTLEPSVPDIIFKRKADAELSSAAYLAKAEGEFELGPQKITFEVKAGKLFGRTSGEEFELVPAVGRAYTIKGASGFSARFSADENGRFNEVTFLQPNGVFTAKRTAK